jgi:murein DD-endopeptidase MepM/ murein hydrolase activator NlpD
MYRQEVLSRVVRRLYMSKTVSDMPEHSLGTAEGLRLRRFGQLVSREQASLTQQIGDSLSAWEDKHVELTQTRQDVKNAAAGKEKEKNRKSQQLAKAEREAFSYRQQREQEFDELENIQREAMILSDLIERLAALPSVQAGIDYDFPGWKGRLHWPLSGAVKSTVGRKVDPRYKTETYETGMFIAGNAGIPVVNAADGEVAFTGRRKGLGNVVVVGHGSGYFSIFAHLEEISVISGTMLRAGEQVGTAGSSHPRFGTGVLFELRHNRDVLDPLEWLR